MFQIIFYIIQSKRGITRNFENIQLKFKENNLSFADYSFLFEIGLEDNSEIIVF